MAQRPPVVLAYFELDDLQHILAAVRATGLAERASLSIGNYGVSVPTAARIREVPGVSYAPMLALRPTRLWDERPEGAGRDRFAGRVPRRSELPALPPRDRVLWGHELGARFRDRGREAARAGAGPDMWQFDEVVRMAVHSRPLRQFLRGVFDGLRAGRPREGDELQRGFVWISRPASPLARLPVDAELDRFWRTLDAAAAFVAGEEFPRFLGDARGVARDYDSARAALAAGGPVRRSLARRYLAGITPGNRLTPGLGGNVGGWPRARVNRWRSEYLRTRAAAGAAGFGVFNFRFGNSSPTVIRDVLTGVAEAL